MNAITTMTTSEKIGCDALEEAYKLDANFINWLAIHGFADVIVENNLKALYVAYLGVQSRQNEGSDNKVGKSAAVTETIEPCENHEVDDQGEKVDEASENGETSVKHGYRFSESENTQIVKAIWENSNSAMTPASFSDVAAELGRSKSAIYQHVYYTKSLRAAADLRKLKNAETTEMPKEEYLAKNSRAIARLLDRRISKAKLASFIGVPNVTLSNALITSGIKEYSHCEKNAECVAAMVIGHSLDADTVDFEYQVPLGRDGLGVSNRKRERHSVDMVIRNKNNPDKYVAVMFDGELFHVGAKKAQSDNLANALLANAGHPVIRFRDVALSIGEDDIEANDKMFPVKDASVYYIDYKAFGNGQLDDDQLAATSSAIQQAIIDIIGKVDCTGRANVSKKSMHDFASYVNEKWEDKAWSDNSNPFGAKLHAHTHTEYMEFARSYNERKDYDGSKKVVSRKSAKADCFGD